MKKLSYLLLVLVSFYSCKKDDGPTVQPVDLQVKLVYQLSDNSGYELPYQQVNVTLRNLRTGSSNSLQADNDGKVTFAGIAAGDYDIDASVTFSAADYLEYTGIDPGKEVVYNGSLKSFTIQVGFDEEVEIPLITGQSGSFVIKQVYYAGSDKRDGAIFRDQFIEIYNNTDGVLFADSLYIATVWGKKEPNTSGYHFQPNGQMDWSKSLAIPTGASSNTDYVYIEQLFMVPGDGDDHPIQPGKSIVIAQNAVNHKVPYVGATGREQSVRNPDLTVDLSGADFETYYGDIPGVNPLASDFDNPEVPNLEIISYTGRDMILDNPGRESYAIFKTQGEFVVKDLPSYYPPLLNAPTTSTKKYIQLRNDLIMDAVEVQPTLADNRIPKKLFPLNDAGFAFVAGDAYSSQSVIRKTARVAEGGRVVLSDTNNSTEDFVSTKANPRGFAQ